MSAGLLSEKSESRLREAEGRGIVNACLPVELVEKSRESMQAVSFALLMLHGKFFFLKLFFLIG